MAILNLKKTYSVGQTVRESKTNREGEVVEVTAETIDVKYSNSPLPTHYRAHSPNFLTILTVIK